MLPSNADCGYDTTSYRWGQNDAEVTVTIPLPAGVVKGSQLSVTLHPTSLNAALKQGSKAVLLTGSFYRPIKCEESLWTIEDYEPLTNSREIQTQSSEATSTTATSSTPTKALVLRLQKASNLHREEWWPHVTTTEPQLDMSTFVPPSKHVSELEEGAQARVAKMMYDQRQREAGLPTSDEERIQQIMREHPPPFAQ